MIKRITNLINLVFKKRPATIENAAKITLKSLTRKEKKMLKEMEENDLILLHNSLGRWIRNTFGLWGKNPKLLKACDEQHPDDASFVILKATWRKLKKNEELN